MTITTSLAILLTIDPLMKQMPFPDTNYGKQNKQKQTLKPIIIRPLMQTRWGEVGAYQLLEVISSKQSFTPQVSLYHCIGLVWFNQPHIVSYYW